MIEPTTASNAAASTLPARDRTREDWTAPLVIHRKANQTFTDEDKVSIKASVLNGLAEGTPLAVICREPGMPSPGTVGEWKMEDESFGVAYAHAREAGWDIIALKARETARGAGDSSGDVQRDKLIVDTDFRLLRAWNPTRYGDSAASTTVNVGVQVNQVSEEQRAKAIERKQRAIHRRKSKASQE